MVWYVWVAFDLPNPKQEKKKKERERREKRPVWLTSERREEE